MYIRNEYSYVEYDETEDNTLYIMFLYTDKKHARRGYATAVLRKLIDVMCKHNYKAIQGTVYDDRIIPLYTKLGFTLQDYLDSVIITLTKEDHEKNKTIKPN